MVATLPWSVMAGGHAVTFGATGIHYARQGVGRMWTAVAGTTLGAVGLAGVHSLVGFAQPYPIRTVFVTLTWSMSDTRTVTFISQSPARGRVSALAPQ